MRRGCLGDPVLLRSKEHGVSGDAPVRDSPLDDFESLVSVDIKGGEHAFDVQGDPRCRGAEGVGN